VDSQGALHVQVDAPAPTAVSANIDVDANVTGAAPADAISDTARKMMRRVTRNECQSSSDVQSGQLISEATNAFHAAFLSCPMRVMEPIYRCSLQCEQSQLGNLYATLSRRRGVVLEESVVEGTTVFVLEALLPVASSFGFAQELLKKTSGRGTTPQLSFSHWMTQVRIGERALAIVVGSCGVMVVVMVSSFLHCYVYCLLHIIAT
jgi:hypothetical protein